MRVSEEKNEKILNSNKEVEKANTIKWKGWERIPTYSLCIFLFISMGFVAVFSLFESSTVIDGIKEKVVYLKDNILINLLFILVFFAITLFLYKFCYKTLSRISERTIIIVIVIYTLTIGLFWVLKVQSVPTYDSEVIYRAAVESIKGDYSVFSSINNSYLKDVNYFNLYPFQLGLVFISEIIYRIFGHSTALPLEIVNVVALALMYVALLKISKLLFDSKGVQFILAVFLAMTIQPAMLCTFAYGNIIGFSVAMWSCYMAMKFLDSEGKKSILYLALSIVLITISVLAKYNNMICMIAIVITVVMYSIKYRKWTKLISIVLFILIPILSQKIVVSSYEARAGVQFEKGFSQIMYLNMGFNESERAPGWYTGKNISTYVQVSGNQKKMNSIAKKDISKRINYFGNHPIYAGKFFSRKILSQWNDPVYGNIWNSKTKSHYNGKVIRGSFLDSVYDGKIGELIFAFCNKTQMLMFVLFSVAMIALMKKKQKIEVCMLLTILVGGFLYHLLFEAKSQYITTYYILISFFASYGFYTMIKWLSKKFFKETK